MAPPSFPPSLPLRPLLPFLLTKCVAPCVLLCEQARACVRASEGPKRTRGRVCERDARELLLSFPFPSASVAVSPPSPAASLRGRPAFLPPRGCRRRRLRLRATTAAPTRRAGGRASLQMVTAAAAADGGRPPLVALRPPFEQGGRPARARKEWKRERTLPPRLFRASFIPRWLCLVARPRKRNLDKVRK